MTCMTVLDTPVCVCLCVCAPHPLSSLLFDTIATILVFKEQMIHYKRNHNVVLLCKKMLICLREMINTYSFLNR